MAMSLSCEKSVYLSKKKRGSVDFISTCALHQTLQVKILSLLDRSFPIRYNPQNTGSVKSPKNGSRLIHEPLFVFGIVKNPFINLFDLIGMFRVQEP